ncbi:MAG: LamG domain-containing protein [Myxococcales bacterium]|nr:LamG domain-containing protein [Myxococcales bacterium]
MRRALALLSLLSVGLTHAATSSLETPSPMGGNGHNVTFDGRLFIVRTGPGWEARVLRPQAIGVTAGQPPSLSNAFSPGVLIQGPTNEENALAICEATAQPTSCDAAGAPAGTGTHRCYELVVIDSNALTPPPGNVLRRRRLRVVVSNPNTAQASVASFTWTDAALTPLTPTLRGIEPTVTRDGKLMVWQGHPNNSGVIDTLVYSVNATACGVSGWSAPKTIAAMNTDPAVQGRYRLAERPLRDPGGVAYTPTQLFYGAYPWIFPDGEAINFTGANMPCRTPAPNEDPPGCGPRRNALSVIGYPTNWQLSHIDGALNPDTDNTVRLFFTSPGPMNVLPLPLTQGQDVWPFFGSNTSNYGEVVFDDALDGRYAALWHLNEFITAQGNYDRTRAADSSGYSNTGTLRGGASYPARNNGLLGKALSVDGLSGRLEVPHATSLLPVNAITIELALKPRSEPNCDANNNYRLLLGKPNINGAYSLVLEEDRSFQARVRVAGGVQYDIRSNAIASLGQWTRVAFQYDAATGTMVFMVNGVETNRVVHAPAVLAGTNDLLFIGAPGVRAACPNGDGAFDGELDEVAITRAWRYGAVPGGGAGGGAAGGMSGTGGGMAGGAAGGMSGTGGGMAGGAAGGMSGTGGGMAGGAAGGMTGTGGGMAGGAAGGMSGTGGGAAGGMAGVGGGSSGGTSGVGGGTPATGGGTVSGGGSAGGTGALAGGVAGTGGGSGGGSTSSGGGGRPGVSANTGCSSVAFDGASWLAGLLMLFGTRRRR